jgi:hypothetical protein
MFTALDIGRINVYLDEELLTAWEAPQLGAGDEVGRASKGAWCSFYFIPDGFPLRFFFHSELHVFLRKLGISSFFRKLGNSSFFRKLGRTKWNGFGERNRWDTCQSGLVG